MKRLSVFFVIAILLTFAFHPQVIHAKPSGSKAFCRTAHIEKLFKEGRANTRKNKINLKQFYSEAKKKFIFRKFREYREGQFIGSDQILQFWNENLHLKDRRWLAYILATTFHETAATMRPIPEHGKGRKHSYGKPHKKTGQRYYGRGYVQLTWYYNYLRADRELKLNNALVLNPALALEYPIAKKVLYRGLIKGWFGGDKHCLPRYFRSNVRGDWKNARRMVNVQDKWELIKREALAFVDVIKKSEVSLDTELPVDPHSNNTIEQKPDNSSSLNLTIAQREIIELKELLKKSEAKIQIFSKELDAFKGNKTSSSEEPDDRSKPDDVKASNVQKLIQVLANLEKNQVENQTEIQELKQQLNSLLNINKNSDDKLAKILVVLKKAHAADTSNEEPTSSSFMEKLKSWVPKFGNK